MGKKIVVEYYAKNVYGIEKFYVADQDMWLTISSLTGRTTLALSDMTAFQNLGLTFKQVLPPPAAKKNV